MAETNEDPVADDTGEDHMVETGEDFAPGPGIPLQPKRGTPLWLRPAKIPLPGPGKILPWRKSGRINPGWISKIRHNLQTAVLARQRQPVLWSGSFQIVSPPSSRLFEKVFGKRLCFHCQSAPRQFLEERHSEFRATMPNRLTRSSWRIS